MHKAIDIKDTCVYAVYVSKFTCEQKHVKLPEYKAMIPSLLHAFSGTRLVQEN